MPDVQPENQAKPDPFSSLVARLAGLIASENFPNADRAALKRMDPEREPPLAFYRFAMRHLPDGWQRQKREWLTILQGLALMSPRIHDPGLAFGRALAENRYSEARLERLLATREASQRALLSRAMRFLAAKKIAADWRDIARLALTQDSEKRESLTMKIATDYYRNQPHNNKE